MRNTLHSSGGFVAGRLTCLAALATQALIDEAELTPKPGLVDRRGPGAHVDLCLGLLRRSALALQPTFEEIARTACGQISSKTLRERLGEIGRDGERKMMAITNGINTHRGAIWILGLLIAGAALSPTASAVEIATVASTIAQFEDRYAGGGESHGSRVCRLYGVHGAKGEACGGFVHVVDIGLPMLQASRFRGVPERLARLDAMMAIMATLDDTCVLHRGGVSALNATRAGARRVLGSGGVSTSKGWCALHELDQLLRALWVSPGGSADVLAATLFLDSCNRNILSSHSSTEQGKESLWND
jgi:triphosphoribosyl-dephospho-CoA synthase